MIDPWAWVLWLLVALFLLVIRDLAPVIKPHDDSCVNHPSTTQCACRKNLPKGGKK